MEWGGVSRSSKIGLRKKPDVEEAGWKILSWNAACNKRACMEEGLAHLSDLQMLGTVSTKYTLALWWLRAIRPQAFPNFLAHLNFQKCLSLSY